MTDEQKAKVDSTIETITKALNGKDASMHLVHPMAISVGGKSLGVGVQVKVGNRKTGPVIFPAEGETVADVLKWLGGLVNA